MFLFSNTSWEKGYNSTGMLRVKYWGYKYNWSTMSSPREPARWPSIINIIINVNNVTHR